MAKKKLLPFWMIPAHWGLSGKAKQIALINYNYDGIEADLQLAEVHYLTQFEIDKAKLEIQKKYGNVTDLEFKLQMLDIELLHGRISKLEKEEKTLEVRFECNDITEKDYDAAIIERMKDGDDKVLAAIEFSYKYGDITELEYEKEIFTLKKEPWINFDFAINPETNEVDFIFDYNEFFIKKLKETGHPGSNDEEMVDNFIRDLGRKIATDDYSDNEDVKLVNANEGLENLPGLPEGFKSYK